MRVMCKVLDAPTSAVASYRAMKGTIALGTINTPGLKTSKPCLSVFTAGKEIKYPLDGSSKLKMIHEKFIHQGKLTIEWLIPNKTIMISEAKPEVLRNLVRTLRAALTGKNVESLKQITKEKRSDLGGQRSLVVKRGDEYPKCFPTATLKSLVLSGINRRSVDGRWFSCTLLTTLDLSRNRLNLAPDLHRFEGIKKLINLQVLNLSHNGLDELPDEMLASLPLSLLHLDLSFNRFNALPSLVGLPSLILLNMAKNQVSKLPDELRNRPKLSLRMENNLIKFIPYLRSTQRDTFSIHGNPLDEQCRDIHLPELKCLSLVQLAMQSIRRNRICIDVIREKYTVPDSLWELIDFCDYCRVLYAADLLYVAVQSVEASSLSMEAAFNTRYPTRIVSCRRCHANRNRSQRIIPIVRRN